jgi:hypothetical protein
VLPAKNRFAILVFKTEDIDVSGVLVYMTDRCAIASSSKTFNPLFIT